MYFPVNFVKFLRTPFLQIISRRLLLHLFEYLIWILFFIFRVKLGYQADDA